MSEIPNNNFNTELTWIIGISIGLFILSIIFNIFFLINGLLSTALGIYYVVSVNTEISKTEKFELSDLLYGYSIYLSWALLIFGILSIFIYIILIYMNRNKVVSINNSGINKNAIKKNYRTNQYYVNTNRYLKN